MITGGALVRPSTEQRARTKPHWQINNLEQSFQDLIRTIHTLGAMVTHCACHAPRRRRQNKTCTISGL